MTTRVHGPLIPLYLAYSPEILLLARCLWYVEDAVRARGLIESADLPGLARPCFELLISAERPVSDDPEDNWQCVHASRWVVQQNPQLGPLVELLVCVPSAAMELVTVAECVKAIRWKDARDETSLLEQYPALTKWRDAVLTSRKRASPLAIAAAWELEALEAELAGYPAEAQQAKDKARDAVARRSA